MGGNVIGLAVIQTRRTKGLYDKFSTIKQGQFQDATFSVFPSRASVCRKFNVKNRKPHARGGGIHIVDLQPDALKSKSVIWRVIRCRMIK